MYKLRPSQDMNVVLDARWREGVWLGKTWGSISNRIAIDERHVIEARAVQRIPLCERWYFENIAHLVAVPWLWKTPEVSDELALEVIMVPRPEGQGPVAPPAATPYIPRRVYITKEDLERWGVHKSLQEVQIDSGESPWPGYLLQCAL